MREVEEHHNGRENPFFFMFFQFLFGCCTVYFRVSFSFIFLSHPLRVLKHSDWVRRKNRENEVANGFSQSHWERWNSCSWNFTLFFFFLLSFFEVWWPQGRWCSLKAELGRLFQETELQQSTSQEIRADNLWARIDNEQKGFLSFHFFQRRTEGFTS